ncbi:MAG TPA: histidine kinase, partial [Ktedonobacteraceae bacterium]|nr:histidine kinase [Ktedonobacteraceae bacterium]
MESQRFTQPFRQLRGKLTFSYTLTSVVTFLLVEIIGILVAFSVASADLNTIVANNLEQEAPLAASYYTNGVPNEVALTTWLHIINVSLSNDWLLSNNLPIYLTVVDPQGQTIASIGTQPVPLHTAIQPYLSSQNWNTLRAQLHSSGLQHGITNQENDGALVAIAPIDQGGKVVGALVMKIAPPDRLKQFQGFLALVTVTATIVTLIAAISGLIFGYLTARGLVRRLKRLSGAADRWGRGDFSAAAHDASEDELGQTARQLNRMAEQLQNLLKARQELATLEERNRLARDLHDSVKQQVFAISMQIGATKLLLNRDPAAAETHLEEAEKLVHQAQQELTSLIRELRPVALEGKGLVAALRELAADWSQQTNIVANLRVEDSQALSLEVEEALYRVAQEALSNAARHSQATLAQMILTTTEERATLTIVDNGQGFDASRQGRLGVGLLSMQERMKALGGDAQIESTPGKGTKVVAYCSRTGKTPAKMED